MPVACAFLFPFEIDRYAFHSLIAFNQIEKKNQLKTCLIKFPSKRKRDSIYKSGYCFAHLINAYRYRKKR